MTDQVMNAYICTACGSQLSETAAHPASCPICDDERQFVPDQGQGWTTLQQISDTHLNSFQRIEPQLMGIRTIPIFAIGQRAILIQTEEGNYLWDCISLIDQATIDIIRALGGLRGIAISHPHFYSTMVEWSRAFGKVPIYLHAADSAWVMRPDPAIHFWEGAEMELGPGLTLLNCGGHFPGGTVLHWAQGADGRGLLLTGDVVHVVADTRYVSFMYSYPNLIPLSPAAIEQIVTRLAPYPFDRIYGAWRERRIMAGAKAAVARSAARYLSHIQD